MYVKHSLYGTLLKFAYLSIDLTVHATILAFMFQLVEQDKILVPLFDPTSVQVTSNAIFVQEYVAQLIKQAFNHLTELVLDSLSLKVCDNVS